MLWWNAREGLILQNPTREVEYQGYFRLRAKQMNKEAGRKDSHSGWYFGLPHRIKGDELAWAEEILTNTVN